VAFLGDPEQPIRGLSAAFCINLFENCPNIRSLCISHIDLSAHGPAQLGIPQTVIHAPSLRHLTLDDADWIGPNYQLDCPQLRFLDVNILQVRKAVPTVGFATILKSCTSLHKMRISLTQVQSLWQYFTPPCYLEELQVFQVCYLLYYYLSHFACFFYSLFKNIYISLCPPTSHENSFRISPKTVVILFAASSSRRTWVAE